MRLETNSSAHSSGATEAKKKHPNLRHSEAGRILSNVEVIRRGSASTEGLEQATEDSTASRRVRVRSERHKGAKLNSIKKGGDRPSDEGGVI